MTPRTWFRDARYELPELAKVEGGRGATCPVRIAPALCYKPAVPGAPDDQAPRHLLRARPARPRRRARALPGRSTAWSTASRSASSSSRRTGRTACAGSRRSGCRCSSTSSSTTSPTPWQARSRRRARSGVAMLTLHVAGGPAMLRAAVEAARAREPCPRLIGVTVLTSLDDADLAVLGIAEKVPAHVARLAGLAWDCGLDGIVCAPHEVALLRSRFAPDFTLVVPGIRPSGSVAGDQKRTKGPAAAVGGRRGRPGDRPADHRRRAIRAPQRRRSTPRSRRRGRPEPWRSRSRSAA